MGATTPPAVADGVVFGRSPAKIAGLIALNGFGFLFGIFLVWAFFKERAPGETQITWWGLLVGLVFASVTPIISLLLARSLWVRRRLVIAPDRLQMVESRRGADVVVMQIPFANIAEMKSEATELERRVGIDLHWLDDPDTYDRWDMFASNRQSDGRHFCVSGGYVGGPRVIFKALDEAYGRWAAERPEVEAPRRSPPPRTALTSQFPTEPYAAKPGVSVLGLPVFFGLLGGAGAGLGWLASAVGQWFYLIVLYPFGIGFLLLIGGFFAGRLTKMRSPAWGAVVGLAAGLLAVFAMHWFDYQRVLADRQNGMAQALPADGLLSFLDGQASEGLNVTSLRGGGFNLGYFGTWLYWGVELVLVAGLAVFGPFLGAAEPFCEDCNSWKKERPLGTLHGDGAAAAAALTAGDVGRLTAFDPTRAGGNLPLFAAVCPNCDDNATIAVTLYQTIQNAEGQVERRELARVTFPGAALAEFDALFGGGPPDRAVT